MLEELSASDMSDALVSKSSNRSRRSRFILRVPFAIHSRNDKVNKRMIEHFMGIREHMAESPKSNIHLSHVKARLASAGINFVTVHFVGFQHISNGAINT